MIKLLFEAYNDNGDRVYSDEKGMHYTEVEKWNGADGLYKNVPFNEFGGTLGERVEEAYEVYDENVKCGFCDGFFEEGCVYIGGLGYNQTYACDDCIEDELSEIVFILSKGESESERWLISTKELVTDNKLNTCFDLVGTSPAEQEQVNKDFATNEDLHLFVDKEILEKLGCICRA